MLSLSAHGEEGPGDEEPTWDTLQPRHRPQEVGVWGGCVIMSPRHGGESD